MLKNIFLFLIRLYQKTLSPDHGLGHYFYPQGACVYRPTCSEFMYEAVQQFGLKRGLWLGLKRLGRCHPWHSSEYDPVTK